MYHKLRTQLHETRLRIDLFDYVLKDNKAVEPVGKKLGVFLSRYKDHIPNDLPNNILYCEYAPFSKLLPVSSALVHHGGIGTCAQALRAGVPQLLTPFGMDQYDNSSRLAELGVGDEVCMKKYKSSIVVKKLRKLLEDKDVHTSCKKIAYAMKNIDPISDVCLIIEDHVNNWKSMQNNS